jgi:hypothetical protein
MAKTAERKLLRDELRRNLFTDGVASGMRGGLSLPRGGSVERGNLNFDANGEATSGQNHEGESTDAEFRGGSSRSSDEPLVMRGERRG